MSFPNDNGSAALAIDPRLVEQINGSRLLLQRLGAADLGRLLQMLLPGADCGDLGGAGIVLLALLGEELERREHAV